MQGVGRAAWHLVPLYLRRTTHVAAQHLVPIDDLRPHDLTTRCWCRPIEDDEEPDLWAHNALDEREAHEDGRRAIH